MIKRLIVLIVLIINSLFWIETSVWGESIWSLYNKGDKELEVKNYAQAFDYYKAAYEEVQKLDNKLNYSRVFTKYLTTGYVLNPPDVKNPKIHRTLYIIVKHAAIDSVEDTVHNKTHILKPAYEKEITKEELEGFKKNAEEFDLVLTALAKGNIIYKHDIKIVESTQKDLIMRHIYENWFGKDIYIYTTNSETITPPISHLFKENYRTYNTFSLIMPSTLEGDGHPGMGTKETEFNIMEGGVVPTRLPIIPYILYGEEKGFFINNINTASMGQMLHEYFHMIENLIDTGYPSHAWIPGAKGPPGITAEMEYYLYCYERFKREDLEKFLIPRNKDFDISGDSTLYEKALAYSKKHDPEDLKKAYVLYKKSDKKSLEQALDLVPDYPLAGVLLGGLERYAGNHINAYKLLKINEDLDPYNNLRHLYLAWLFSYNLSLAEYGLPYYDQAEKLRKDWDSGIRFYFYEGRAKGLLYSGEYDRLLTLVNDQEYKSLTGANPENETNREMLAGKGYFHKKEYAKALLHFKKAGSSGEAQEYADAIGNYYLDKKLTIEKEMKKALTGKEGETYSNCITRGKDTKEPGEKLLWFFKAAFLDPGSWLPWYYLGDVYKSEKRWANSLYAWEKMSTLSDAGNVQQYYHLNSGLIYWEIKDEVKQGEHFSRYVSLKEDASSFYYNELINYYDRIVRDKKAAFAYAEQLLRHENDKGGWYYARALLWCYENGFKADE